MRVTLRDALDAGIGRFRAAANAPDVLTLSTDTRTLRPGETYVALRGERFDGHDYLRVAVERGAAAVVVDREEPVPPDVAALVVPDTLRAYMQLARLARATFPGKVCGITGSAGKTTTKEFVRTLLQAAYGADAIAASPANENNQIGTSKFLLSLREERIAVVEMGARHPGDIARLVEVAQPDVGVLTNVGEAHLEIFGSRAKLEETKWGLFSSGARAVLNANDAASAARAPTLAQPPVWFGLGEARGRGVWLGDDDVLRVVQPDSRREVAVRVRVPGRHNRENLVGALAAAYALDAPLDVIAVAAAEVRLPSGRYERIALHDGIALIFDAYNANRSGMMATLDAFALERGRRIAVLSSMAELGVESVTMHEDVGRHAARTNVDVLLVGGEFADSLAAGARAAGMPSERIVHFSDNAQAVALLQERLQRADVVLIKGSRKYRLEEIVEGLRA